MSLSAIERMLGNIAAYSRGADLRLVSFIWHGGEPFMLPLSYYREIAKLQDKILSGCIPEWKNELQTNLTIITDQHLQFLRSGAFFSTGIGVSFDVYGNQRVDKSGKLRTETVLTNLQRVLEHKIDVGAITVLARNTLPHAREIYRFFDRLGIPCRFLPYYLSASDDQIDRHAISAAELVDTLKMLFEEWLQSASATPVDPIDEYLTYAVAYLGGVRDRFYNRDLDEYVFVVDTNGGVWGQGEAYVPEYCYGDLTTDDLGAVLASAGRHRAIARAEERLKRYCGGCPYFGACPGFYVGDATPQQEELLRSAGCPVRSVMDHVIQALDQARLTELVTSRGKTVPVADETRAVRM